MTHVIGIDIGGTNIRLALYAPPPTEGATATPIARMREEVGDVRAPEAVCDRLRDLCATLLADAGVAGPVPVGIGFAGMMRGTDGTVALSPHLGWRNVPFGAMMRERLGAPVAVDNDVNVITYGEWKAGAGRGVDDLLAVFVGTGIGGGMVAAGRLVPGASGCAGEIGHSKVIFTADAQPCACGLRGCVEAYAGGTYVQRRIRAELAGGARSRAVELAGGDPGAVNPGHLDAAAAEGDDYALALYEEIAPLLGAVLANAVTLLDPARLVLGGGMLSRTPVFRAQVLTAFDIAVNPPSAAELEVVDAALGDDAGLVGGALLAIA